MFARYRYNNAKRVSSKQEKDSDSEYDPSETTTNSKKKKKKSMKEEADSDDDDEEENEQKNDFNSVTPKRQLFKSPKRQLSKSKSKPKKDEKWKRKTFHPFKFTYSIAPHKSECPWAPKLSFNDISCITTEPHESHNEELYTLQSTVSPVFSGKKITVDYDKKHIMNDKDALQQLYDLAFYELWRKPIKPKPKKKKKGKKSPPKKDRHVKHFCMINALIYILDFDRIGPFNPGSRKQNL